MNNEKTLAQLTKLVARHNELRKDMDKAEAEICAHLNNHLKKSKGDDLRAVIKLIEQLKNGHA